MSKYCVTFYLLNNRSVSYNTDDVDQLKRLVAYGKAISFLDNDGIENIIPAYAIAYLKILKI